MKSKKLLLIFILCGMYVHQTSAADLDGPSTTFSSPINFCSVKAKEAISELDKLTLGKVDDVNKIKSEINDLSARKTLISGFLKIRDDFSSSYNAIQDRQKSFDKNISNNLDAFKTLLKTSLTMSAVNLIAQSEIPDTKVKTVLQLCEEEKKSTTNFCLYIKNKFWVTYSEEIKNLDKTVANVYQALGNTQDQQQVKDDLKNIYNTIPSPVAPDKILGDLMQNSPHLVKALEENKDKQAILNCLTKMNDDDSCKNLLKDSTSRESIKKVLTAEMNSVHREFTNDKFDDFFEKVQASAPKTKEEIRSLMNNKANDVAHYLEGQLAKNGSESKSLELSAEAINKYKAACIQKENKEFNLKDCIEYSKSIAAFFEHENNINNEKLQDAINRLDKVVNDNGSLESIEKMKEYVAQKYMRTCKNAKEKDIVSKMTCPCLNENDLATNLPGDKGQLAKLNLRLSNILGKLKSESPISNQRGELGPFSKQELEVYKNYCQNTTLAKAAVTNSICRDVYSESNQIANLKESQEWEEFNKKYWVEYSKTSERGYEVYEKKSNARIFGEGLSQSIQYIYPAWLGNFQLSNQIDMMTNQALYQKQMIYMNSENSPWMNFPYFQGTYFPPTTGVPTTQGFSF